MKYLIIGIGEALWDCFCNKDGEVYIKKLGGAPANFVFHATQLGMDAQLVSALGDDEDGRELKKKLDTHEVKSLMKIHEDIKTGVVKAFPQQDGETKYEIIENVAYDHIPFSEELEARIPEVGAVCFGTLAQRRNEDTAGTVRKLLGMLDDDALKVYDINIRPTCDVGEADEIFRTSLKLANVLKINEPELGKLAGLYGVAGLSNEEICRYFIDECDLKMLIYTLGEDGSIVYYREGQEILESRCCVSMEDVLSELGAVKDEDCDTVGAGDSFTAAFISALLKGKPVKEAHELASRLAAYVCTKQGAMPQMDERVLF